MLLSSEQNKYLTTFFPKDASPIEATKHILKVFNWREIRESNGDLTKCNEWATQSAFLEKRMFDELHKHNAVFPSFYYNENTFSFVAVFG